MSDIPETQSAPSQGIPRDFLSSKEVVRKLPISERTLKDWRLKGLIPAVRLPGARRILFYWPDVQEALRKHRLNTQEAA